MYTRIFKSGGSAQYELGVIRSLNIITKVLGLARSKPKTFVESFHFEYHYCLVSVHRLCAAIVIASPIKCAIAHACVKYFRRLFVPLAKLDFV